MDESRMNIAETPEEREAERKALHWIGRQTAKRGKANFTIVYKYKYQVLERVAHVSVPSVALLVQAGDWVEVLDGRWYRLGNKNWTYRDREVIVEFVMDAER
jgi:hypothetical protein